MYRSQYLTCHVNFLHGGRTMQGASTLQAMSICYIMLELSHKLHVVPYTYDVNLLCNVRAMQGAGFFSIPYLKLGLFREPVTDM